MSLNVADVFFFLAVVTYADKQKVVGVFADFCGIVFVVDLVDGGVDGGVVFQFDDDGGFVDILAWNHYKVGKSFA